MVEVDCTTARPGGVTLVAVRLDNRVDAPGVAAHRVELVPDVDGPVWPPRVEGVPAGPWELGAGDDAGAPEDARVSVVVPTGRVGSVGFASPGEPGDPPVEVAAVEPAGDADEVDPTPEDVLRVLGDPSPPRDAVAVPESAPDGGTPIGQPDDGTSADQPGDGTPTDRPDDGLPTSQPEDGLPTDQSDDGAGVDDGAPGGTG